MNANAELVHRHYDDFVNRGDLAAADRDLRPDFVDHAAPDGPPGPDAAKGWIEAVRSGFPAMTTSSVTKMWAVLDYETLVGAIQNEG